MNKWNDAEVHILRENYPTEGMGKLKGLLPNRTGAAIKSKADYLKLTKTKPDTGSRFKKGHKPWNKGMKSENRERIGRQKVEIGHISPKFEKGIKSLRIKTENGWAEYHRYLWEKEYDKIPSNCCIVPLDGDKTNCSLENWEMITKSELMKRNANSDKALQKKQYKQMKKDYGFKF